MSKIVIVVEHARKVTYCERLGQAYRDGAISNGHDATLFVLSKMFFDPILHEGFSKEQPLEPDLADAQAAIGAADHLVVIFPLWFGTLPAILKGFIERIMQPGFAMKSDSSVRGYTPLLTGKSARVIITMGMPAWLYQTFFLSHGIRALQRNIFKFTGFSPVRTTMFGMVHSATNDTISRWTDAMRRKGSTLR